MYVYDDHIKEEMTYKDTTLYFKPYLTNTSYHNNYRQRKVGLTRLKYFVKVIAYPYVLYDKYIKTYQFSNN